MEELLLSDDDYYQCLTCIDGFAAVNEIEYNPMVASDVLRVTLLMMTHEECSPEVQVLLAKVIYNMGYRENDFNGVFVN